MKLRVLINLPLVVGSLGAFLLLSPASRAQEISPDHFDGPHTEPLHPPRPAPVATPNVSAKSAKATHTRGPKSKPAASLQLATTQDIPQPLTSRDAIGVPDGTAASIQKPKER